MAPKHEAKTETDEAPAEGEKAAEAPKDEAEAPEAPTEAGKAAEPAQDEASSAEGPAEGEKAAEEGEKKKNPKAAKAAVEKAAEEDAETAEVEEPETLKVPADAVPGKPFRFVPAVSRHPQDEAEVASGRGGTEK